MRLIGAILSRICCVALAASFVFLPAGAQTQKKTKRPKKDDPKIENYYGGVFLIGEGGIPSGPCFRINGRITSADFFNTLKSYESSDGTIFRRGTDEVTRSEEHTSEL